MATSCVQKFNMFKIVLVDSQTCCEYCTIRFKYWNIIYWRCIKSSDIKLIDAGVIE